MKKTLLLSAAALLAVPAMMAQVPSDGETYEAKNGLTLENLWNMSTNYNSSAFTGYAYLNTNKCRTACIYDGIVYVGNSTNDDPLVVGSDGVAIDCCGIEMFNALTGEHTGKLQVTWEGSRVSGLLCANQVGVDSFGNLYVAGYVSSEANPYVVYVVDKATGEATSRIELPFYVSGRIDYCDVIGDLTLANADCIIMAAGASAPASTTVVYRWGAEQGQTAADFTGAWGGFGTDEESQDMQATYPADQTNWGTAPMVRIVEGEGDAQYAADLFYVDGFTTVPTLYDTTGSIVDSFENAQDCTPSNNGTNGVNEIQIGDHNLIVYSNNQHTGSNGGNELWVAELGEGMAFTGMTQLWMVPTKGLGMTSDTGTRIHCIGKEYYTTSTGAEGCYILTFKTMNGMGVYSLVDTTTGSVADNLAAAKATISVKGGVIAVSETASSIEVYNVAGQLVKKVANVDEVAAPAAGAYIVKAVVNGNNIVKKVVL